MTDTRFNAGTPRLEIFRVTLAGVQQWCVEEEAATPRLSPDDCQRAEAPRVNGEDRDAWRAARLATRIVLERWCGAHIRQQPFVYEAGGRPRLADGRPWFSVSHSAGVALVAVSDDGPIGVDYEMQRPLLMSAERQARIIAAADAMSPAALGEDLDPSVRTLQAWVRLEAIAKARGTGLARLLTEHGVIGGARSGDAAANAGRANLEPGGIVVRDLRLGRAHFGAIAGDQLPEAIHVKPFPQLRSEVTVFLSGT